MQRRTLSGGATRTLTDSEHAVPPQPQVVHGERPEDPIDLNTPTPPAPTAVPKKRVVLTRSGGQPTTPTSPSTTRQRYLSPIPETTRAEPSASTGATGVPSQRARAAAARAERAAQQQQQRQATPGSQELWEQLAEQGHPDLTK